MRVQSKGKHEIRKRFGIAAASVMVAAGLIGAVAATASTPAHTSRPPLVKGNSKHISSTVPSFDVFGAIDRQGAVTYAFGGEVGLQRDTPLHHRRGSHPPRGCWSCWSVARTRPVALKCNQVRTVTLFRVEPNGSATRIASATSHWDGQSARGSFTGPLERPLGEITGYYYAEVAPATINYLPFPLKPRNLPAGRRAAVCLPARSPTIFVKVPAGLLNSQ
jgi:hypothetical protein